jgi:hypothetical protein
MISGLDDIFLELRNVSDEAEEKNQNTLFPITLFPPKIKPFTR